MAAWPVRSVINSREPGLTRLTGPEPESTWQPEPESGQQGRTPHTGPAGLTEERESGQCTGHSVTGQWPAPHIGDIEPQKLQGIAGYSRG